jgi:hypothetical protein
LSDVPKDIAKLWTTVLTLKTWAEGEFKRIVEMLVGVNGSNGIRGDLKLVREEQGRLEEKFDLLDKKVDKATADAWHLWEVERFEPGKCIGATEVRKLEEKFEKERLEAKNALEARNAEARKERREARALQYTLIGAIVTSLIASVPAWINVFKAPAP